jgi:hypothetical protein
MEVLKDGELQNQEHLDVHRELMVWCENETIHKDGNLIE